MKLGLLGAGTVGLALAELLSERSEVGLSIGKALVRDVGKARAGLNPDQLTSDPNEVLRDADLVVEVMGGTAPALDLTLQALRAGKPVVTANKAVLAERWGELEPFIRAGRLYFEAAVMAGTPAIGPLTGALRGSKPIELHAILNGTCAYILSELERGVPYGDALAEAQRLGYAEADPTLDVLGFDAAHKLAVLARLGFDPQMRWEDVKANTRGIETLTPETLRDAEARGGRVRLVGSVYPEDGLWRTRVRPVFLPHAHPLSNTGSRNALYFRGDAVGEVFIMGAGAGGRATASGVLSDVIAVLNGRPGPSLLPQAMPVPKGEPTTALEEVL